MVRPYKGEKPLDNRITVLVSEQQKRTYEMMDDGPDYIRRCISHRYGSDADRIRMRKEKLRREIEERQRELSELEVEEQEKTDGDKLQTARTAYINFEIFEREQEKQENWLIDTQGMTRWEAQDFIREMEEERHADGGE